MNQQERRRQSSSTNSASPVQRVAGKRSRSDGLAAAVMAEVEADATDVPVGALQLRAAPPPDARPGAATAAGVYDDPFGLHLGGSAAHATAERGVAGSGGPLPHLDTIQASFGRHDVSGVSAHVGGAATQASVALGAEAYATGTKIAFGSAPSLHTAAHEAAHVVQQRQGVSLKGGMGEQGDPYEQHADRVADAVVAGRSAESLLDHGPGGGGRTAVIQKEDKPGAAAPPAGAPAAPAAAPPAPPPDTEGDKLRKAVLAAAEKRLKEKTNIVSQARIDDIRSGMVQIKLGKIFGETISLKLPLGTPMKNFTTCIEFAGQTFGDGTKAVGQGAKDQTNLARLLPQFLMMMNKEIELHTSLEAFQKSIHNFDKPIADTAKRQADMKKEIKDLKGKQNSGNKQADIQTNTLLKTKEDALRQVDAAMAKIEKSRKGIQDKIDKLQKDLTAIDAKDDAWIKPQPGLKNGRPKPGEYILSGAASAQPYGVKADTKVTLAKGSFKHIAVFKSKVAIDPPTFKPPAKKGQPAGPAQPRPGKWEEWTTIDGGGLEAKESKIVICLDDLLTFHQKPEGSWAVAQSQLIGWIDMNTLVSDGRKPGGVAPAPAVAAAPAAPAAPAPKVPAATP